MSTTSTRTMKLQNKAKKTMPPQQQALWQSKVRRHQGRWKESSRTEAQKTMKLPMEKSKTQSSAHIASPSGRR
jgi:hypothetical protein